MSKDSFVLYVDTGNQIDMLSDEEAGRLFKSLFHYVAEGQEPANLQPATMMAFRFIRSQLDRDAKKYEEVKRKRAEAGRIGGKQSQANRANASFAKQIKQNQANQADNVSVPVSVNDNVSVSDTVSVSVAEVPAATYEAGEECFNREKRVDHLRRMLKMFECEALCDPEAKAMYQAELDSLLQEDTE